MAVHHSLAALQPCVIVAVRLQAYRPALFGLLLAYQILDLQSPCMIPGHGYNLCADKADSATDTIDNERNPSDSIRFPRTELKHTQGLQSTKSFFFGYTGLPRTPPVSPEAE